MFAKTFVVEGPDRVGKQTQTNMLVDRLREVGNKVKLVEVPFNDRVTYSVIYWMLKNGMAKSLPNLFQFIQFLNKFFFQVLVLPFLMVFYDYVIFDRWALSAIVYGNVGGANSAMVSFLDNFLFKPRGMVVLTGRAHIPGNEDVYESDSDFQGTVREYYSIVSPDLRSCETVNANQSREAVHAEIKKHFDHLCNGV
jgi:thymidylate kinase